MASFKKSFPYGQHQVTIETGEIARQAGGAVIVSMAETVVLVTAVANTDGSQPRDFFPLTVNYQEKTYAVGCIPGGFFRRRAGPWRRRPSFPGSLTGRSVPCFLRAS